MLEQISWKEFLIAIGGGCVAYYAILAASGKIRFARNHSSNSLPLPAHPDNKVMPSSPTPLSLTEQPEISGPLLETSREAGQANDQEFAALELLADEIQVIIIQNSVVPGNKQELLTQLRKEIARYPTLNQPAFQRAINNLIIKVAREECQLTIKEEEARECWPAS